MNTKKISAIGKKTITAAISAIMLSATCATTYADTTVISPFSEEELTNIGGYMCYQRDDNYWTMIDGEEYLVVDTRNVLSSAACRQMTTFSLRISANEPPLWTHSNHVTLPSGGKYTDKVDISTGNYYSPIFDVTPVSSDIRFKLDTNHIVNNEYNVVFWYHFIDPITEWHSEPDTLLFNVIIGNKLIIPGTMGQVIDKIGIEIDNSSDGRDDFKYTITML